MAAEMPAARSAGADAARLAAAFFVVLIHSSDPVGYAGALYNSFSRFGVPVFIVLSGYFMLARERTAGDIVRRSARLIAAMLLWSALYYAELLAAGEREWAGAKELVRFLLTEPMHMWYIYTAVFLYAITPALYVFCSNAGRGQYLWALLVCFALGGVLELAEASALFPTLMTISSKAHLPLELGFVFLYLAGGYFRRWPPTRRGAAGLYAAGCLSLACTVAGTLLLSRGGSINELLLSYTTPFIMLTAAAFALLFLRSGIRGGAALPRCARCTLGVYLMHPLFIRIAQHGGFWDFPAVSPYLLTPLRCCIVYALALAASLALSRAPLIKRLVS